MPYRRALLALTLVACTSTTEPGVPLVVGAYCQSTAPVVTRTGADLRVELPRNELSYNYVTSNGHTVQQEVRSCAATTCIYQGGASMTDADAVTLCRRSTS